MITINNLSVSYGKIKVLNSLNLIIPENSIAGIVGLNGSGKTTLFNAVFGFKNIDSGEILIHSEKLTKKSISYLPAENYFYPLITGREYLSLFKNERFDTDRWNELFTLPLDTVIDEYSTGMKKKLALMGVIRMDKPVILLDEPFNSLDMESCRILRLVLLRFKKTGKTVIVSSHILETLTNLCDSIHCLENGNIKYSKSKEHFTDLKNEIFGRLDENSQNIVNALI
jgi:ABC-2 type transport system ATP-binding protein